jgi:hypothetical protein
VIENDKLFELKFFRLEQEFVGQLSNIANLNTLFTCETLKKEKHQVFGFYLKKFARYQIRKQKSAKHLNVYKSI